MSQKVTYERTGGFIGIHQRLELTDGTLLAEDRRSRLKKKRALTTEEQDRLATLLGGVEGRTVPTGDAVGVADGFVLNLELPGRAPIAFHTLRVPFGGSDGSAFEDLFSFLDRLLAGQVEGQGRGIMQI